MTLFRHISTHFLCILIWFLTATSAYAIDSTPPILNGVTVSSNSVLVGDTLTITVDAADTQSGISAIWVSLISPINQVDSFSGQTISFGIPDSTLVRTATIDYPGGIEPGLWKVDISMMDNAGNVRWHYPLSIYVKVLVKYSLNSTFAGTGQGNVLVSPSNISYNTACSTKFDAGTQVTLHPTPMEYSLFTGWAGDCSGGGDCTIVMDTDKTVTATFNKDALHALRIDEPSTSYYSAFSDAYSSAMTGSTIMAWGTDFTEDFHFNKGKTITIKGGCNSTYSDCSGLTSVYGTITVEIGAVTIDNVSIQHVNAPPVSNAGINQDVSTRTIVGLDGSRSYDIDSQSITYNWSFASKPAGSNAIITNYTSISPTFTPDVDGQYTIKLIVNDGKVDSQPAYVTINAISNNKLNIQYIANNGMTVTLTKYELVDLGGYINCNIAYTQKNTTNGVIDEATFKLYLNDGTGNPQYGFFDSLYPSQSLNRTYTFQLLKTQTPTYLEYDSNNFFSNTPLSNSLKWSLPIPN